MSEPKIEKDIPLPPVRRKRESKYPFAVMEVGDSIFVPLETAQFVGGYTANLKPKKFASRQVDGGVRVWRIA